MTKYVPSQWYTPIGYTGYSAEGRLFTTVEWAVADTDPNMAKRIWTTVRLAGRTQHDFNNFCAIVGWQWRE